MFQIEIDEDKYLETVLRVDLLNTNLKYGKLKQTVRNAPWSCRRFPTGFDIDYSPQENTFSMHNLVVSYSWNASLFFQEYPRAFCRDSTSARIALIT